MKFPLMALALFGAVTILLAAAAVIGWRWTGKRAERAASGLLFLSVIGGDLLFAGLRFSGGWVLAPEEQTAAAALLFLLPIFALCGSVFSHDLVRYRRKKEDLSAVRSILDAVVVKAGCTVAVLITAICYLSAAL